ncbi:hypothetical protein GCM10012275_57680 [Longimycelium tulufanense]|uniref:IrrE N-terminal-like domain-containing protein n=1 Tax=Longimycelium tulufanense TaxID=907463 RepID=A0A8J3FY64_9PSEU|nr:hypothetical protein [Longimycelium tulufanense]GGM79509.1 hypothetical protein GCM10012275_57680 [Longimycelium tulufanense]
MSRRQQRKLIAQATRDLEDLLTPGSTYRDVCEAVRTLMERYMQRPVLVDYATLQDITGVTALLADGRCVVVVAAFDRWSQRLLVLLHEFAHYLLGHMPAAVDPQDTPHQIAPHLSPRLVQILASRSACVEESDEHAAEQLADELFERTERRLEQEPEDEPPVSDSLARVAESLRAGLNSRGPRR